jgi:hypothetical protein
MKKFKGDELGGKIQRWKMHTEDWPESLKRRYHVVELGIVGRIILK